MYVIEWHVITDLLEHPSETRVFKLIPVSAAPLPPKIMFLFFFQIDQVTRVPFIFED